MSVNNTRKTTKIYIVENEVVIAADLAGRLNELGYEVCGKETRAEKALESIEDNFPDLVLMDILIDGEMDGIDAAEVIREKWSIPVVFLTAYAGRDRLERAKLTYPFGYILKPFQNRDLRVTIEMALYVAQVDAERKKAAQALRNSEERYRSFVQNFRGIAFQGDMDFVPIFFHGRVVEITGYTEEEFKCGKPRWDQIIHPDDRHVVFSQLEKMKAIPLYSSDKVYRIIRKDGAVRWVNEIIQNVCDDSGKPIHVHGTIQDVSERKELEKQREELINELKDAISEIKVLRGFLPICSKCKKIRDDDGYWLQIEKYIQDRTDAKFSHSICPDCARKLYPDFFKD